MKLTIFMLGLLAIATARGEAERKEESADSKEKREAPVGHYSGSSGPRSSHTLQIPSRGHGANAISVGAGYSIGGGKHGGYSGGHSSAAPSSSYSIGGGKQGGYGGGHSSAGPASSYKQSSLQHSGGHQAPAPQFQLPNGQVFPSLEELMQSLRDSGLHIGTPTQGGESVASAASYAAPHGGQEAQIASFGGHQAYALPHTTYGGPKLAPITLNLQPHSSVPSYAAGVQGLGAYASGGSLGSTSPQLFSPAPSSASFSGSSHSYAPAAVATSHAPALSYGAPSSGYSFGDASQSFGDLGHSLGGSSGGFSFGGSGGHSFGGPSQSFGGSGQSFGGSGHSFGGLTSSKGLSSLYGAPSTASFKPSAFLGASMHGDSYSGSFGHGGGISADALSGLGEHGASFSSGKFSGQAYLPPSAGFGSSFGGHSFGGLQGAFSGGHSSSPPGTSYGIPSGSYGIPGNAHVSSSNNYYQVSSKYPSQSYGSPSFGQGSSAYSSPSSSHGSIGSLASLGSLGSSHGYQQSSGSSYGIPDSDGDHSESSYNTIKYSSNLNPKKKM